LTLTLLIAVATLPAEAQEASCQRTLTADVVALDQPFFWNRLGAAQPQGQIYALKRDVVGSNGGQAGPGNAVLRDGKRPRPLVLRMNVGDCLEITFTNWLSPNPSDADVDNPPDGENDQPVTREASIHVVGMQLQTIADDGSWVGKNPGNLGSLVGPGGSTQYRIFAQREGTHLLHSAAAMTGGPQADNGTTSTGLFGAVNVEPAGSVWYRSQLTEQEFSWATTDSTTWPMPDASVYTGGAAHGFPVVDYNAVYPTTADPLLVGLPILTILNGTEIVHSDLNAIISGGSYDPIGVYPNRDEPFREFTIIFHDEIGAVQAFPHFYDCEEEPDSKLAEADCANGGLAHTLHSVRDAFAINYGTGGIGSEILANRLEVGPMHECVNCLYEEFFLSSWAVGDPAMVVDVPANAPCTKKEITSGALDPSDPDFCLPTPGPKATKAFYPDDPSNVYHSYLNDHVKFRNLLAGSDDHHIFHLHAHQWLHTPDGDKSTYLDSQAIGQGTAFTYEIAHEGSGNRNKTPGDSIFHCHFYPHFAQGMWSMWRVHDVLEIGTPLDKYGRPTTQARALPDGEIPRGTPIPALVPLPGEPMPPPPSVQVTIANGQVVLPNGAAGNPGYPFYIPAQAGQRVPAPPLDIYHDGNVFHDGGLPRHLIFAGAYNELHTRLDFSKDVFLAKAYELDHFGEFWERQAMDFHADRFDGTQDGFVTTYHPDGLTQSEFELNGQDEVEGAPYADPCYRPAETGYPNAKRFLTYKAANIEMDVVFNKKGWHFPQQRFLSLWEDVDDYFDSGKPPEPLFIRANTYDCVEYLHTNLVPKEYELDDFQVRTPTDILGQHIHLVKFDVTSSDGGANGFNYEDGTLSPEEVRHVIDSINAAGGLYASKTSDEQHTLTAQPHPHPYFAANPDWLGAQTTVQRWYVDDVLNNYNADRTLRTVFTHDHFGPSTHQQVGLYAGLVTEREGSLWLSAIDESPLGTRHDGGPTSWQAIIDGPETFREFVLEFGDFQHAYTADNVGYPDPAAAINPPGRHEEWNQLASKPWIYEKPAVANNRCPDGATPPCPEAVSAEDPGTMVVNYRNEPIALRVKDASTNAQASGTKGDLSWAFNSIIRDDTDLNVVEPNYAYSINGQILNNVRKTDPYTPIMQAYEDDEIRIRVLVGAHEEEHNFSLHGSRWLFEPEEPDSGYKASQMMGISEFYDFRIPRLDSDDLNLARDIARGRQVDFLYKAGSSAEDLWNGIWGLIRVSRGQRDGVATTSNNRDAKTADATLLEAEATAKSACPSGADLRPYNVFAISVADSVPGGQIDYNDRPGLKGYPLNDPTGIMFVRQGDLQYSATMMETYGSQRCAVELKPTAPVEPLILRAEAGECIQVKLTNCVMNVQDALGYSLLPNVVDRFNQNQVAPSENVGLHAQLVTYNMLDSDGMNVGANPIQTVAPNGFRTYTWYAGIIEQTPFGPITSPVEFGSIPLFSSDPIKHTNKGAVGALIIEPQASDWIEYPDSRAKARILPEPGNTAFKEFREYVLVFQNDINLQYGDGTPIRPLEVSEDPAETGQSAVNYRTEPVWFREQKDPETLFNINLRDTFANQQVPADPNEPLLSQRDPKTPVFHAVKGDPVRFRVIHPGGDSQVHTWGVHGHIFEETPYTNNSKVIGSNPASEWKGAEYGHGPTNAFDALLKNGAGGEFQASGDFMWRDHVQWYLAGGIWGIFRVHDSLSGLEDYEPAWPASPEPDPGGGTVFEMSTADGMTSVSQSDADSGEAAPQGAELAGSVGDR